MCHAHTAVSNSYTPLHSPSHFYQQLHITTSGRLATSFSSESTSRADFAKFDNPLLNPDGKLCVFDSQFSFFFLSFTLTCPRSPVKVVDSVAVRSLRSRSTEALTSAWCFFIAPLFLFPQAVKTYRNHFVIIKRRRGHKMLSNHGFSRPKVWVFSHEGKWEVQLAVVFSPPLS